MLASKKKLFTFSVVCLKILIATSFSSQYFSKDWVYPNKSLTQSISIGKNVTIAYALCDVRSNNNSYRHCSVNLEILNVNTDISIRKTCDTYLIAKRQNRTIDVKYNILQLIDDKIIFIYKETTEPKSRSEYLTFRVIHMANCQFYEADLVVDQDSDNLSDDTKITSVNVVPYHKSFEVFYRFRRLCDENRLRIRYDLEANVIIRPVCFLSVPYNSILTISALNNRSPTKGYVIENPYQRHSAVRLIDQYSHTILTHEYSRLLFEQNDNLVSHLTTSSAHEMLGICQQMWEDQTVKCWQFDNRGHLKLSTSFTVKTTSRLRMINLTGGGFDLMLEKCQDEACKAGKVEIVRVDKKGRSRKRYHGTVDVSCSMKNSRIEIELFSKGKNEQCYYLICYTGDIRKTEIMEYHLKFQLDCYFAKI